MSPRLDRLRAVRHAPLVLRAERLEDRALLATFTVTNLLNAGTGSLRDAIAKANASPGADEIAFGVAGTIALDAALPGISGPVTIAGGSAPGFATTPRVTVNFAGRPGLRFLAGSDGSRLESLALVRALGNAVTIDAANVTLAGNFIGVLPDGRTAAPNQGHGVLVNAGASGARVGVDTSVSYAVTPQVNAAGGGTLPVAGWQGLTTAGTAGRYLITGTTTNPNAAGQTAGLLYVGAITAQDGAGYVMVMPNQGAATTDGTTAYSADHLGDSRLRIVGTYSNTGQPNELGFIFNGTVADVADGSKYTAMPFPTPTATWNIPHSTSGGLVVGNYDSSTANGLPAGGGRAYVYDAVAGRYLVPSLVFPGSASNTAYGIWWNGGTSYTICGGYAESPINNLLDPRQPLSKALLVDYDSTTGLFTNWKSFSYTPPSGGAAGITHFEGISGVEPGAYTLAATALVAGDTVAGFVRISRNADGSFGDMQWTDLAPPVVGGAGGSFADSVYGNAVVGIDPTSGGVNAYQGTVAVGGNVIGGNRGHGVAVAGRDTVIASNMIGVTAGGTAAVPNGGDGVRLLAGSSGTLVGRADPVSAVAYANAAGVSPAVSGWQGLRAAATPDTYLFAGTSGTSGLLYVGPIDAVGGTGYPVNVPSAVQTSGYGPDLLDAGRVRVVGSYVNAGSSSRFGFLYQGAVGDLATAANYRTIRPASNPQFTYARSTMGGLVVGNYDSAAVNGEPVGAGKAFLYDVAADAFLPDIVFPGSVSNTAYGIWFNGGTSYTICGGYALDPVNNLASDADQNRALGRAFLVDYDAATRTFANWKSFTYPAGAADVAFVTHFQGISGVEDGVYTLAAASAQAGASGGVIGSLVTVRRATDGTFGIADWQDLAYPGASASLVTSVYGNAVTGIATGSGGSVPFQATVTTSFQLSNVIGGNVGNGIAILGATQSRVMMNAIGTSVAGTAAVPNRGQGVLVSNRAAGTLIGGQATGGNDPTGGVFVRPPQGNLISGNRGDGVRVTGLATGTTLSGNFVGTTASGNAALGNGGDGVAIVAASGTSLLGTTFRQSPFVFYNVLAGNSGNGLRITNATDTIVQANFAGVGADNATVVANGGSGILANGRSSGITAGGPIPLGNVTSGNDRHGIEIAGGTSGFVSFNNFAGMVAFGGAAPNKLDGINITAVGGRNLVRTSLVAGNRGNGITIAGNATGVTVEDTAAGTNAAISAAVPNGGSGILITGNARGNTIGGFQPSIETKVHLSGNGRYGLEVTGRARDNRIFNAVVGAGFVGTERIPNSIGGIFVGPGTSGTVIGGAQPFMANRVLFNTGTGVTISGSGVNQVIGNEIRSNTTQGIALVGGQNNRIGIAGAGNTIASNGSDGIVASGNLRGSTILANTIAASGAAGLRVQAATNLLVGGTLAGVANTIAMNAGDGLLATGDCRGTRVIGNVIADNAAVDVNVAAATGIIYVP
jgi:hypothetical protein